MPVDSRRHLGARRRDGGAHKQLSHDNFSIRSAQGERGDKHILDYIHAFSTQHNSQHANTEQQETAAVTYDRVRPPSDFSESVHCAWHASVLRALRCGLLAVVSRV
jgi:hypothetical protein